MRSALLACSQSAANRPASPRLKFLGRVAGMARILGDASHTSQSPSQSCAALQRPGVQWAAGQGPAGLGASSQGSGGRGCQPPGTQPTCPCHLGLWPVAECRLGSILPGPAPPRVLAGSAVAARSLKIN